MPKNKGKGGKNRRRGKNENESAKRELTLKETSQEYGLVKNVLGSNRLIVQCMDGVSRICIIRGKMRKKVWISTNDYVLVALRDYQPNMGDIVHKYNSDEVRSLLHSGEIVELNPANATDDIQFANDATFDFESDSDSEPDIMDGFHNPNHPLRAAESSEEEESDEDDEEDEDDDESDEDDDDDEEEEQVDNTKDKLAKMAINELIGGKDAPAKVDYKINSRKQTSNTLDKMARGSGSENEGSSDDEQARKAQVDAQTMEAIASFQKTLNTDRYNKNKNKKRR